MNAVISGRAGRALIVDGQSLKSFDVDDPSKLVSRRPEDLHYLLGEGQDLRVIENSNIQSIAQELKRECDFNTALDLSLISLDAELPDDIRSDALEELDELLANSAILNQLENVLYARPLPDDGDLTGALRFCDKVRLPNAYALLQNLETNQALIFRVSSAWDAIPTKIFDGYEPRTEFQRVAVREGLFRSLVAATQAVSTFLLNANLNPAVTQLLNYRPVLQQWTSPFRTTSPAPAIKHEIEEECDTEASPRRRRGRRVGIDRPAMLREVNRRKTIIVDALHRRDLTLVSELVDELVDYQRSAEPVHVAKSLCDLAMEAKELGMHSLQLTLTERSVGIAPDDGWSWAQHGDALLNMQRGADALEAFRQAEAFGEDVIAKTGRAEVLKAQGQFAAALTAYDEVIKLHPEDVVAMSGRAEVLKAQGQFPAALAAFAEVIRLYPEDVFAKNGRAEVLKAQGQFPAALAAYDEVISLHPEDVFAKTGRAEVLKAQGQFPAALAAYDEAISMHPENVVAKNGRAEVLKAQGQFPAALAAFAEVIRLYPEDVFAKNGRAEVLKAQGQFPAALAAFAEVISLHPENVVAKNGRAEVLKAQGQFPAALAAYDEVISLHPENVVAKTGRSCVLAALGRYEEALEDLPEAIPSGAEDWIGYHVRGMILLHLRDIEGAIRIFRQGVAENPIPSSREYFQTALTVALIRQQDFAEASSVLREIEAPTLQAQVNVLSLHAFGEMEQFEEANAAFQNLEPKPWSISDELIEELHRRYILKVQPRHTDDWVFDQEISCLLLVANQQPPVSSYLH